MKGIIGKKLGMTSFVTGDGKSIACTLIEAGPCYVTALRTKDNDGYSAIQLGMIEGKDKHLSKPVLGKFKKHNLPKLKIVKEIRDFENAENLKVGDVVGANLFKEGDRVKV